MIPSFFKRNNVSQQILYHSLMIIVDLVSWTYCCLMWFHYFDTLFIIFLVLFLESTCFSIMHFSNCFSSCVFLTIIMATTILRNETNNNIDKWHTPDCLFLSKSILKSIGSNEYEACNYANAQSIINILFLGNAK